MKNDVINKLIKALFFFICVCIVYGFCHRNYYAQEYSYSDKLEYLEIADKFVYKGESHDTSFHLSSQIAKDRILLPNPESAFKTAFSIAQNVYGKQIVEELPFTIELVNDSIWKIKSIGTCKGFPDTKGGAMFMFINKRTAEVLHIIHEE